MDTESVDATLRDGPTDTETDTAMDTERDTDSPTDGDNTTDMDTEPHQPRDPRWDMVSVLTLQSHKTGK